MGVLRKLLMSRFEYRNSQLQTCESVSVKLKDLHAAGNMY